MDQTKSEKFKDFWWSIRHNRGGKILVLVSTGLIVILGLLFGLLSYYGKLPWGTTRITLPNMVNEPSTITDNNTIFKHRPIAVIIENLVDIRPQAGLDQADLVYEALVEGGITRFLAIYTALEPTTTIGPIRSARTYFVDWAEEYDGMFVYVGGSPEALGLTNSSAYLTDLNQFYHAEYYYRTEDAIAPHNLFSRGELLLLAVRDLELETVSNTNLWAYKTEPNTTDLPATAAPLTINYSSADYLVEWRYDVSANSYIRWNGEVEQPVQAKNIIVQRVATSLLEAATGRLAMTTLGEGDALLFQDGHVQTGRWIKSERGQRTAFVDDSDAIWEYNAGTTWIEIVPLETSVTY